MEGIGSEERFEHADPAWRVPIKLPTASMSIDDIRPGDIVYTRRPKGYQRLTALAGDTWRHVGIATTVAGYPWLLEMAPFGRLGRPLTSVVPNYDTIAVQSVRRCEQSCGAMLINEVAREFNTPMAFYDRAEQAAIGALSWTRLIRTPGRWTRRVQRMLADRLLQRPGFEHRAVCSTAIARAITQLCEVHDAQLDVWSPKHHGPRQDADERHHQLSMPDDIWRALQNTSRHYWIKKNGAVPVMDHIDVLVNQVKGVHTMAI